MKIILMRVLTGLRKQTRERQEGGDESLQLQHATTRGQKNQRCYLHFVD